MVRMSSLVRGFHTLRQSRLGVLLGFVAILCLACGGRQPELSVDAGEKPRRPAPELTGGVDWLNTSKALSLEDLQGRVVLLDFWTLCCINCIHVMPDLAKLEAKYP